MLRNYFFLATAVKVCTYEKSESVVGNISRRVTQSVCATVTKYYGCPRGAHRVEHRWHRDVREVNHHSKSVHLQYDTLKAEKKHV